MSKKFIKNREDFVCENCGEEVVGDGFTNHCPKCLWSKHVDVNPGDRDSDCGGVMRPVELDQKNGEYIVTHQCIVCGYEKRNKISEKDNFEEVIKMMES